MVLEATKRGDVTSFRSFPSAIVGLSGKVSFLACALKDLVAFYVLERPGGTPSLDELTERPPKCPQTSSVSLGPGEVLCLPAGTLVREAYDGEGVSAKISGIPPVGQTGSQEADIISTVESFESAVQLLQKNAATEYYLLYKP